jgi:uncharacterized protein YecT (DUF1311 family)
MKLPSKLQGLMPTLFLMNCLTVQAKEKEHLIDKVLKNCLERHYSTMETVQCLDQAYTSWDKELNRVYKLLEKQLQPADKQILKRAQLDWLKYRDNEFKVINMVYSQLQGTMYIPVSVDRKIEVVKKRVLELVDYSDILKQQ